LPDAWKETRMILIAKKESICSPALTRPISLIDSFLKIGERLFLNRFRDVLLRRGLLPDNQSGFRDGFRLQTRLLLFLEDVYSLMSNSAPVCTIFIDFRSDFDQLWHSGCIGKLFRLGIPRSYILWIDAWLRCRRCYIEIKGHKSRYFNIEKGGPQGSVLTPTLFISYHCDMGQLLSSCTSHFFADDVAAILAGQMGVRFTDQCLDLEKRVKSFLDRLEFYSCLSDQPLNRSKTDALFSAHAIGYIISSKLDWGKLIKDVECKVRKRISLIRSFKLFGCSSPSVRKVLFYSHVLPLFTWIYPVYPLLTRKQQESMCSNAFQLLPNIINLSQLDSVYIYQENREKYISLFDDFNKIIGIYDNYDELIKSIKENIKRVKKQMEMFSYFDQNQYSLRDLSVKSAEFLWFQLLKNVLLSLSHDDEAKNEMLNACRQYYRGNHRMNVRRSKNGSEKYIYVYRGTTITKEIAETLKLNHGKLIATNCFWSTSRRRSYALSFAHKPHNRFDMIPVLFEIECDLQDSNNPDIFADISTISCFPIEEEVLFDVGAVFETEMIKEEEIENMNILGLAIKTTGEGMEIARKYIELNQREMEFESPKIMLCNLLKRMNKSDESLKFLQQFLKNPGNENIAHIYNLIGLIFRDEKKYEAALEYFEKAFNLYFYSDSSQQKYAAFVLHNRGTVYAKMKQLNKAWSSQWRGLQILDSMGYVDSHWRALFYRSIGRICLYRNKFDKAMKFYITTIYFYQHQYNEALLYHLQALEIRQKYLVPNNHEIGWSLHVGKTYYKIS
ncbi:unnamed protein product, partial [Adineta steineri]